jgi:glycine/D-amino acid oxidase-like deaminating enzyme
MPTRTVVYELGRVTTYYRLDATSRLLFGGRSAMHDVRSAAALGALARAAGRLWPALGQVRWTHGWNGQIAMTRDHYPHLHEPAETVHIGLGYNGRSIAMATLIGTMLARRALGDRAEDIALPITTIRAYPFHALWRSAVTASIAYGRTRDSMARRAPRLGNERR